MNKINIAIIRKLIKPARIILTTISVLGLIYLIFIAVCCSILFFNIDGPQCDFNSERWKDDTTQCPNDAIRVCMINDLLHRYKLVGMTRTELEKLLGKPPPTNYFRDYEYVYWLGPERSYMSIDSEWLCINFKNDKVSDARILRD